MQVSIICIYNNEQILNNFLKKGLKEQIDIEYETILVNNTNKKYKNAKEALIEGCKNANGKYLVFAHQDILFEDNKTLKKIYDILESKEFGIAGVAGKRDGNVYTNIVHGNFRKKAGDTQIEEAKEVDTLDECLFIIRKDVYSKLSFENLICNTWHLYAVEYSLLSKQRNKSVIVLPIELYHRSSGASFDNTYYKQIRKLVNVYGKGERTINTTIGNWYTNILLLNLQIIKRQINIKLNNIK